MRDAILKNKMTLNNSEDDNDNCLSGRAPPKVILFGTSRVGILPGNPPLERREDE